MKRVFVLIGSVIFFVLLDFCGGQIIGYFYNHAKSGYIAKDNYVSRMAKEDIIVFGSSRAFHHYIPQVIADETGLSVFNAGRQGQGIIYAYGKYLSMRKHHIPKVVLLDFFYEYDLLQKGNNSDYLQLLKPYAQESEELSTYFREVDKMMSVKMKSQLYVYNSRVFNVVKDYLQKENQASSIFKDRGFEAKYGSHVVGEKVPLILETPIDSLKIQVLHQFAQTVSQDGGRFILVFSPIYHDLSRFSYNKIINELAVKYEFWNEAENSEFTAQDFFDEGHLNMSGAVKFSKQVASRLNELMEKR